MQGKNGYRPAKARAFGPKEYGRFVKCGYWGTWDFVLGPGSYEGSVLVVTVTPVNWAIGHGDWSECGKIREHSTWLEPRDLVADALPESVIAVCLENGYDPRGLGQKGD